MLVPSMNTLANFLTDDVGDTIATWINFALDDKRVSTSGNASGLDKEGNYIIIGDLLHEEDEVRVDTLQLHKNNFIEMLLCWDEVASHLPDEIIITQDDQGKITMAGKFNDGREI